MKLPFWKSPERFLVAEILPGRTRGLLFALDGERRLTLERFWDDLPVQNLTSRSPWDLRERTIIAAADPSLALTIFVPVRLDRQPAAAREALTLVELENLIAQAIARIFGQCRKQASVALGVDEFDTVLVGSRASSFKIDGHRVVNPAGFPGQRIEVVLELTLAARHVFEDWKEFFNGRSGFFFTESARAGLLALSKIRGPSVNLITLRPRGASVFILEPAAAGPVIYREELKWETERPLRMFSEALGVVPELAEELYRRYFEGHVSPHVSRWVERALKPVFGELFYGLRKTRLAGSTYIDSSIPLPFEFPKRHGKMTIDVVVPRALLGELGFTLERGRVELSDAEVFRHLAPFLEFYYDKSDTPINHKLRRRLHWLSSPERPRSNS
ncbi:hypothetical protein C4587_02035 [Candidatus Parcubacteria bacterium]|nr:MAG: hypothetical protein C4587_02035 [Candidatus Parcubacteria bacterium]